VLNSTFFGTPLNDPIQDVFNCLIGIKVQGIEAGLTWVHDHAKVSIPALPDNSMTLGDMFGKSSDLGQFLSDPSSVTQNDLSAALVTVGNKIQATIRQEALLALGVLICYLIVVFSGLGWTIYKLMGSEVVRPGPGVDSVAHQYIYPTTTAPKEPPSTSSSADTLHQVPIGMAEAFNPKSHFSLSPSSPAPAYNRTFSDVNSVAPYTLNPHPFPNSSSNDNNQQGNGRNSRIPFWRNLNTSNNPFQKKNHDDDQYDEKKNGFIWSKHNKKQSIDLFKNFVRQSRSMQDEHRRWPSLITFLRAETIWVYANLLFLMLYPKTIWAAIVTQWRTWFRSKPGIEALCFFPANCTSRDGYLRWCRCHVLL